MLAEIVYPHIDPVLFELFGPLALRWYGFTWVVGYVAAWATLFYLAKKGRLPMPPAYAGDLITWVAVGTIVGGRIGDVIFYRPDLLLQPTRVLRVWEGGMSFHGGLIGVALAGWLFARFRTKCSLWALCDGMALATPVGVIAGRTANFINGEVFGRIADASVPWAIRFPTDPVALQALGLERGGAARVYAAAEQARTDGLWEEIIAKVPLRHPSQLYEALGEGVIPLVLLWLLVLVGRKQEWHLPRGAFLAIFMILYGVARVVCELYREPQIAFGPITMGMVLCAGMMVVSGFMLRWPYRGGRTPELAWPLRPDQEPMVHPEADEESAAPGSGSGGGSRSNKQKKRKKRKKNR